MVEHAHVTKSDLRAGVALDDAVVRVVVLDGAGKAPTVVDAAEADLARGIVVDGRVRDNAGLGRLIGELWKALDLGGVATFLGLQPLDAHVGRVAVSRWPESGPAPEVLAEVAALRAAYGDEVVWSAAPASSQGRGEEARLAVCRREDISSAVWALRRTGVRVTGVELAGLALERALAPVVEAGSSGTSGSSGCGLLIEWWGTGPGSVSVLVDGAVRFSWRLAELDGPTWQLGLHCYPLSQDLLQQVLAGPGVGEDHPARRLVAALGRHAGVSGSATAAALIAPGSGLAAGSPVPVASCAVALGLALGAAGVGPAPLELQACLLNSGVRQMQTRLASVSLRSLGSPSARDLLSGGPTRRSAGIGPEQSRLFKPRAVPKVPEVAKVAEVTKVARPTRLDACGRPWVHRPGLGRGTAHVAVLGSGYFELRGGVRTAAEAQTLRRQAIRMFAGCLSGELFIDTEAHPDAGHGVRFGGRIEFAPLADTIELAHHRAFYEVAHILDAYPWCRVAIEGHSDDVGCLRDNIELSQDRATAVQGVLLNAGFAEDRIGVAGRGPFVPLADGDREAARAMNRRVTLTFLDLLR